MLYCKTNPDKTLDACGCPDCTIILKDIESKATLAMVIEFEKYLKRSGLEKEWQARQTKKDKAA